MQFDPALCTNFKLNQMETIYLNFNNYEQLSYLYFNQDKECALYCDKQFIADAVVYFDAEQDERKYIDVNNEVIYLDTIREF